MKLLIEQREMLLVAERRWLLRIKDAKTDRESRRAWHWVNHILELNLLRKAASTHQRVNSSTHRR